MLTFGDSDDVFLYTYLSAISHVNLFDSILGCGYDGEGGGGFEEIKYEGAEYERRMTKVVECLRKVPVHKFINRRHRVRVCYSQN